MPEAESEIAEALRDPVVPDYAKRYLMAATTRDPVDAANITAWLADVLVRRADAILQQGSRLVTQGKRAEQ